MREIDIAENTTYDMSIVSCIICGEKWLATRPEGTPVEKLECPTDGQGFVFETGEEW